MSEKQQILVVVEPENHPDTVVQRAAQIARLGGHDLTLLWCDPDIGPLDTPFLVSNEARDIAAQIRDAQKKMVSELARSVSGPDLSATGAVLDERPIAEGILRNVQELNPAFVFKGTQYHAAAERSIFVDTDWQLMRSCPCPLWLVKPVDLASNPVIVAAVDPMHTHDKPASLDQRIVQYAKSIAALTDGDVHLFHAYQPLSAIGTAANRTFKPIRLSGEDIRREIREEHQQLLDELADACELDQQHRHQQAGVPRELIPAFTRSIGAQLVVMGVQARWGLKRSVIGSTAERVLDHLPCDTLLISNDD